MKVTRRIWSAAALASACSLLGAESKALLPVIPVFDGAQLTNMLALLAQLQALGNKLKQGLQNLQNASKRLGKGNLMDDILLGHRTLTANLQIIDYTMETVKRQFRRVLPDEAAVKNRHPSDVAAMRRSWDSEIHQSSLAAERSQTTLSSIEANTRATEDIVARSKNTGDGQQGSHLANLQALVQIIGVLNSDLANLSTTLAATERVNTTVAGEDVSEERLAAERGERLLRDYAKPSPASGGLDRRFLEAP